MSSLRAILCVSASALLVALSGASTACEKDHPYCYAGDYRACTCDDGGVSDGGDAGAPVQGLAACLPSGDDYDACVCDGNIPGLSDGGDGG